jgi:hypothetical protein
MEAKIHTERRTAYNSTYPKVWVSFFADTFTQTENSVLRMKFSSKSPALREAAKRCVSLEMSRIQLK